MIRSIRLLGIAGIFTLATATVHAQGWGQKLGDAINKNTGKSDNKNSQNNQQGQHNNNNGSSNNGSNSGHGLPNLGQGLGQGEIVNGPERSADRWCQECRGKAQYYQWLFWKQPDSKYCCRRKPRR